MRLSEYASTQRTYGSRKVPRSVQQSIPIDQIYEDGTWRCGNVYSQMWSMPDINFTMSDEDNKAKILNLLGKVYMGVPSDCWLKICIVSQRMDEKSFRENVLLHRNLDGLDKWRVERNRRIRQCVQDAGNVVQATRVLASQAGRTMDSITRDVLAGGTNVLYAPKQNADGTETEVKSRKELDKTCTLTPKLFFRAAAQLGAMNADPIGDSYIAIIDAVGGVDVYSDQAFTSVGSPGYYDPTTFAEGWNHLDGKSALAFARERHAFASGDIQRGINQMKVIDAMMNKIKSPTVLMSFSKLMDAVSDCFVTSLSQEQISALVRMQLASLSDWDIQSYTVTGTGGKSSQCYSAKGQSLYVMKPDENSVSQAKELIASVLGGEGTVSDTQQTPEKTEVYTPTADPNAGTSVEESPDSVIVEEPAESVPAEQPADEQPAEPTPEAPAESEASTETPAESEASSESTGGAEIPSISLPTQEQVESAANSLHQAASTVLDALFGSSSSGE